MTIVSTGIPFAGSEANGVPYIPFGKTRARALRANVAGLPTSARPQ